MKKILAYISSAVAVLLSASCTERADLFDAGGALSFEAQITDLETRANYVPGEDKYHENEIKTMDWFFFSDEEGTDLLYHKTTSGENANKLTIAEDDVEANGLRGKSYLYAVANGPEGVAAKKKLADILSMPVSTEFTKTEVDDEGSEALKLDVDNLKFIMDTYDSETKKYLKELSPKQVADGLSGSVQETIKVQLSRLAVKFSTKVKIAKSVTTTDTFGNEETWTPILTQTDFDVYMMNALKAGTMSGEPIRRADKGVDQDNYFSYGRNLATVEELTAETDYYVWQTVDPFYTYPQKWNDTDNNEPYIKIIFPWMSDVKGSAEFHYKVVLPTPEDHVFTLDRNCWYQLTATIKILGGTESDYVLIDDVEVSVANWAEPWWSSGSGLNSAKYFYVPTKEFDVYSMDSFDIPINTNSSAKAYITKIEFKDYSKTPTLDLSYTWSVATKKVQVTNSELHYDSSSPRKTYEKYTSEHTYSVSVNSENRYDKFVTFNHQLANLYVQRDITIYIEHSERPDWNETVIIHQHPAIELKKQGAGDVFVNGRFARVVNAVDEDGNSFGEEWNYRGTTFRHSIGGWSNEMITSQRQGTNGYGSILGNSDNLSGGISGDFYTTDVTVTAFSNNNNTFVVSGSTQKYKIGDPRVAAGNWSLNEYLYGRYEDYWDEYNLTRAWDSPEKILIGSNAANERNMIAPHFLVSSALNAMATGYGYNYQVTFANAQKRAATYQEAGYPAGRWRLPTEAEIAFIIARQNDGTLPILYAQDSEYWCASGLITAGTNSISRATYNSSTQGPARFVYDLWYWGDEPMSSNQYHPNQHEH